MALSSNINIDDEWSDFITHKYEEDSSVDENTNLNDEFNENCDELNSTNIFSGVAPEPTNIYISTKSKIAYLEQPIDLKIFWDIPVISYATPKNGVIKKQLKLNSKTPEDLLMIQNLLKKVAKGVQKRALNTTKRVATSVLPEAAKGAIRSKDKLMPKSEGGGEKSSSGDAVGGSSPKE